jgi:hypothetical protein
MESNVRRGCMHTGLKSLRRKGAPLGALLGLTLYHNLDGRTFRDTTASAGILQDSLAQVGWGCALADFDNDGWPVR